MAEHNKFWQRRESRSIKVARNHKLAAGLSGGAAEGSKQMKIVMRKEDLEQLMGLIRDGRSRRGPPPAAAALEQRLNFMRRRQILRSRSGSWRPVLQSIPEEV